MAPSFSVEEEEVLVEEIAQHPPLWQLSHTKYKDHRFKDNTWAEVTGKAGKPDEFDARETLENPRQFFIELIARTLY